jgi:Ca2+-binding EF-hand superfamily protein
MEHCCEISLQRHHKMGKMSYGHLKKMTFNEYVYLINQAYKFLSVSVSEARCRKMFNEMNNDRDNLITYQEYFSILNINASTQELPPEIKAHNEPVKHHELREIQSKLRQYMWERMKKLFDSHVKGRSLPTNETKMRALVSIIVKDFNLADIDYLLYYLGMLESNIIKFEPLASKFIEAAAQLGLKKFMKNHL